MDRAGGVFACVGWASGRVGFCFIAPVCLFSGALRFGFFGKYGGGDEEPWQQSHYCAAGLARERSSCFVAGGAFLKEHEFLTVNA